MTAVVLLLVLVLDRNCRAHTIVTSISSDREVVSIFFVLAVRDCDCDCEGDSCVIAAVLNFNADSIASSLIGLLYICKSCESISCGALMDVVVSKSWTAFAVSYI